MKAPAILLLAASCLLLDAGYNAEAASVKVVTLEESLLVSAIGKKIKEALELMKEQMKTGNPKLGIPVLEPMSIQHQKINLEEEQLSLQGTISDVHVDGLSDYTVQFVDFKIGKKNLTIDMLWHGVKGKAKYDLDGLVSNKIPFYGVGDVDFEVTGLRYATQATMKLDLKERIITVARFDNTEISLDALKVSITGLFNDDELSELVSAVISENARDVLKDFQEQITAQVDKLALKYVNEVLSEISLDDITGIIS